MIEQQPNTTYNPVTSQYNPVTSQVGSIALTFGVRGASEVRPVEVLQEAPIAAIVGGSVASSFHHSSWKTVTHPAGKESPHIGDVLAQFSCR